MIVASHQPCLLPWPGFWHRALCADEFLLSSGVDFAKDSFLNRMRHQGAWLTVPVEKPNGQPIREVLIGDNPRQIHKAREALAQTSGKYAARLCPVLEAFDEFAVPGQRLVDLTMPLLEEVRDVLGTGRPRFVEAPDRPWRGSKTERLYDRLQRHVPDARTYLCGRGTASYLEGVILAPMRVLYQTHVEFPHERSILSVIAEEPDPVSWILGRARWSNEKEAA